MHMIGATGAILYASAVIIPQFAQQNLNYNRDLGRTRAFAGRHCRHHTDPIVGRLMTVLQDALSDRIGFSIHGGALMFSQRACTHIDSARW